PTETTIWSTIKEILPNQENLTIGKAIQNTQIFIVNEQNRPLAVNEVGEICLGGDGVAKGYLNRQELTNEKFISHFEKDKIDSKLYKTGDLGKILDNGEILCLGRIDQQIKIRGHRIELGEIEAVIEKQNGVKQAVVKAQELNPGDKRLIAYITVSENDTAINYEIPNNFEVSSNAKNIAKEIVANWKENLKEHLPAYMVPDYFLALESFPLTPNAKIDRKALPSLKLAITKPHTSIDLSPEEKMVAEIWSAVLGVKDLQATALRTLTDKTGVKAPYLEQVATTGNANRDPRGWSVTSLYMALIAYAPTAQFIDSVLDARWWQVDVALKQPLAFDHKDLIIQARERLRAKAGYTALPMYILTAPFTLTQLQQTYEELMGTQLEKKSFRRKFPVNVLLDEVGEGLPKGGRGRTAALYRPRKGGASYTFLRSFGSSEE
ncbi:MAG: hypothetical protein EOO98_14155, partial [Pedobacter sp.]